MSNTKPQEIQTTAGKLKQVTLEEFVAEIPVDQANQLVLQYNSLVDYGDDTDSLVEPGKEIQQSDSTYVRSVILLGENSKEQQLLHILDQANFIGRPADFNTSKYDMIERAVVESMENFGLPTHVVQLTHNCLGVFCIEDFKYKLMDPTKGGIVCYAPNRNIIFRGSSR